MPRKKRTAEFDPEHVRDVSVAVYKERLKQDSGPEAVERMLKDDDDGGKALRGRAAAYDSLTRVYLRVFNG